MQLSQKGGKKKSQQLKNQPSEPSNQSSLRMEAAPADETLARRLVWELCSRSLKGCGQVGGTSLCSGKGRRREGTGAYCDVPVVGNIEDVN